MLHVSQWVCEYVGESKEPDMARRRTPEEQLQRRLSTYPAEMFNIMQQATQGLGYEKTFATHAEANAFLSRYYRFRMDVIESGNPMGQALPNLVATGFDAAGNRFDSKNRNAPGPINVRWAWQGPPPQPGQYQPRQIVSPAPAADTLNIHFPAEGSVAERRLESGENSAHEAAIENFLKRKK